MVDLPAASACASFGVTRESVQSPVWLGETDETLPATNDVRLLGKHSSFHDDLAGFGGPVFQHLFHTGTIHQS